jgi:serine/threonine protein kinase
VDQTESIPGPESPPPRYRIQEEIAVGGTARIFRAWDGQLHRTVALKRLQADGIGLGSNQLVWTEAMTMASVQHPNIVTIYDFGEDEDGPFVVMELVEGETLDAVIQRGVMTLEDFSKLVQQTLDPLISAHHAGLIHRDLKGANVMLTWLASGSFQVKILDFGLAKLLAVPQNQTVEQDGSLIGSIYTMAPEQFNRQPVDERSDLYSIGCVYYFALTGQLPFQGETLAEVVASHLQHHVAVPLEVVRPDLPGAICDWVMTFINVDPRERFQSARQALGAYARLIRETSSEGRAEAPPASPPAAQTRARILDNAPRSVAAIATAFVLLAAAAIGFGVYKIRNPAQDHPAPPTQSPVTPLVMPAASAAQVSEPDDHHKKRPPGVYSAKDLDPLWALIGQTVTVESNMDEVAESKDGGTRYLKYDHSFRKGISLVFPISGANAGNFAAEKLQGYVGHRVRAKGILEYNQGHLQIPVQDLNQIEIVPDK